MNMAGDNDMCYFGVALTLASLMTNGGSAPACINTTGRIVKGRHRQRALEGLLWLVGVRHSSAVGAGHKPTDRSHSRDAEEESNRPFQRSLVALFGLMGVVRVGKSFLGRDFLGVAWEDEKRKRETEKHRFGAYSHLP